MRNKEDIVERIKKLLALADDSKNDSDEEAKAAMLKAQALMAKYDISVEEVEEQEEPEYSHEVCEHKWDYSYRVPLAHVLADNFRCKTYRHGKRIVFMGHPSDAKICKATFEFAYGFILKRGNQIYNKRYSMGYPTKGVFNSYANGFISGLKEAFDVQCKALAIITPPDVVSKFEEISQGWRRRSCKGLEVSSAEAWREGHKDGKSFLDKDKLPG